MARARKINRPLVIPRHDRVQRLSDRVVSLVEELNDAGLGDALPPVLPVKPTEEPDLDPKTGGRLAKVKEPLGAYLQRVSVRDNYSQRPPFDHATDPIYRRLIRDFIEGALMPESKVAALSRSRPDQRVDDLNEPGIQFSIIDGLQRLHCYGMAILLVYRREDLVAEGLLSPEAWAYFRESVLKQGDAAESARKILGRPIRWEVFWNIDLAGLLHYMVTFNTGQRKMSLPVQLEIMQKPLIRQLEQTKIPIWHTVETIPGERRQKDKFLASDLILATQAFITQNANVTAGDEAERMLENDSYLENFGDVTDVVETLRRVATEIHPRILRVYADDAHKRYILSNTTTFLLGLMAACGYIRNRKSMKMLEAALDSLVGELDRTSEDPLYLTEYVTAMQSITSSRGKSMRRLVFDTFLRFFMGATTRLEWMDSQRLISGS